MEATGAPSPLLKLSAADRTAAEQFVCIHHFATFVRFFWCIIEPGRPLVWNWHIQIICDAIQAQVDGDPAYRRLLILIPPGYMKTYLVSIMRPAWVWLKHPSRRSIYFSHGESLAVEASRKTRNIIESPQYRMLVAAAAYVQRWKEPWELKDDQNQKVNFENTATGSRKCYGLYANWTGARGDDMVIDDPVDAGEVIEGTPDQVNVRMAKARDIINNKMQSRVNDKKTATWTMVMQRLDENDPAGDALKDGDWKVICIPQEYDPRHPLLHPDDPRRTPGETINLAFDDPAELAREKRKMAPRHWQAQRQQQPTNENAGVFPRTLIQSLPRWTDLEGTARACTEIGMSVDCTFANTDGADKVSIQVWGRKGWGRRTLLDRIGRRMSYTETRAEVIRMAQRWGPSFVLVENKANGPAVIDDLTDAIPALIPFNPGRDAKTVRAEIHLAPLARANQVELPDRALHPWVAEVEDSWVNLRPGGDDDDDADAAVQINKYWTERSKQAPWLDDRIVPELKATSPSYSTASGSGRLYVHDPMVLIAPPQRLFCGVVPPTGYQVPGCAVLFTDQGDVVGHVEGADEGIDAFAGSVTALCKAAITRLCTPMRTGRPLTMAQQIVLRIVLSVGSDTSPADAVADAFRSRGFTPRMESGTRPWWWPSAAQLATTAAQSRELSEMDRFRIHDPIVRDLAARATLDPETGVPSLPLTRDVARRMLPRPVAMDALLLALIATSDAFADHRGLVVAQARREDELANPTSANKVYELHARRTYGSGGRIGGASGVDAWAATAGK